MTDRNSRIQQALASNAWPFQEAEKLVKRYANQPPAKGYVLFETGYGPSGLPHIGTFGEVARTSMVRHAFSLLSDIPTRLFAFSDDMDGLRKVPENLPNRDMIAGHLGKPLTAIPDPFGTHESFGHHMNSRLQAFLDEFGFHYEFKSATACYQSGEFDAALLNVLRHYDAVINVILPTLGEERRQTYSPFLPLCPTTGKVLQVPVLERNLEAGTIVFADEQGKKHEVPVTGGHCKLQWKADWAMRWFALDVDYEMCGKDLTPSVELSSQITQIMGGRPPEGFSYELFLDDKGQKISKSKGNGLTIDEWLRYAPPESLALYMYQSPRKAKRLYFDVIPRQVDDYLTFLEKYPTQEEDKQFANPVWHIHDGNPPAANCPVSFGMLLNLASACNPEDATVLWGFISRYAPDVTPQSAPMLARLADYAVRYYHDFVKPEKRYRSPTPAEAEALQELANRYTALPANADAETLQTEAFTVGKNHGYENLREWFQVLYETLFGQTQGPRMGSFAQLYGISNTVQLIQQALDGELSKAV